VEAEYEDRMYGPLPITPLPYLPMKVFAAVYPAAACAGVTRVTPVRACNDANSGGMVEFVA